jgi:hypothetical protein
MKGKSPLEDTLPPDLRARFLSAVQVLHQNPARYDHWNALYAGILMMGDFNKMAQLDRNEPLSAMIKDMRRDDLKPAPAAAYKDADVLKQAEKELSTEVEQTCLAEALDEIEGGPDRQLRAADGWDHGDTKVALTGALGFGHCLNLWTSGAKMARQSMNDEAEAIKAALKQGGTTVAVMPLRQLVAEQGVLEQLKSSGFDIRAPNR